VSFQQLPDPRRFVVEHDHHTRTSWVVDRKEADRAIFPYEPLSKALEEVAATCELDPTIFAAFCLRPPRLSLVAE